MTPNPIAAGLGLALASATCFGLTLPLLSWAGDGAGPFANAALLYGGAVVASLALSTSAESSGTSLSRAQLPTLVSMALFGAALAPAALAFGLPRTGPVTGGLLLNLETVWTVLLAALVYRERLGARVVGALGLMTAGGIVSSLRPGAFEWAGLGALAVVAATLGWALDNTLSRRVSEARPSSVVAAKGSLGAALTLTLALVREEPWPAVPRAAVLLLAGAIGYGVSLELYLRAQRRVGAARTASIFSLAPFLGAAASLPLDPTRLDSSLGVAAALFAAGVLLHLSERHAHPHHHPALEHEHAHRHDDGHHDHRHDPPIEGQHSHPHRHEPLEHAHPHADDVHHRHSHQESE